MPNLTMERGPTIDKQLIRNLLGQILIEEGVGEPPAKNGRGEVEVFVDHFRSLPNGTTVFNVLIQHPALKLGILINTLRIMNGGKLYPPVKPPGKGSKSFFTILYVSQFVADLIYDAVLAQGYELARKDKATRPLVYDGRVFKKVMPNFDVEI